MVTTTEPARSRIDEFLAIYDVSATDEIGINAPGFGGVSESPPIRLQPTVGGAVLMTIRSLRRIRRTPVASDLRQRLQGTGFVTLADVLDEEIAIGVTGKFGRPDGGRCLDLTPADFGEFCRPGYAKAAWNFWLRTESPHRTVLSTQTRIKCFGRAALWKFRLYWILVSPFSGMIRKAILKQVKTEAESTFKWAS